MASNTSDVMGEFELKVDFPKDAGDSKYMKELSEIENETGISIKIVVHVKGKPSQLEVAQKRISEIKYSDKANPVDFKDIQKSISDLQNVSQNNIEEFKTDLNILKKEICESNSEKAETSEIILKNLQDLLNVINTNTQEMQAKLETLTNKVLSNDEKAENPHELLSNMISEKIHQPVINMGQALKLDIEINARRLTDAFKQMQKNVSFDHKVMSEMVHKQLEFGIRALKHKGEDLINDADLEKFYKSSEYINCEKWEGEQPLHTACRLGRLDVVKKLKHNGISLNIQDNAGYNPLHYSCCFGHLSILEYLINENLSIEQQNNRGSTALLLASWKGHKSIVEYLCSKNAKVNIINVNNHTALTEASGNYKNEIIEILKKYGA